tara:strand:+ start:74 stop:382 length:309 start_codon:yes stop_codon:yes gene_type:complete
MSPILPVFLIWDGFPQITRPALTALPAKLMLGCAANLFSVQQYALAQKVYQYTKAVFKDYVANTVLNTAIPAYFGQKKCATNALNTIHHLRKFKSLVYIDNW